jgi:hypothetical protein
MYSIYLLDGTVGDRNHVSAMSEQGWLSGFLKARLRLRVQRDHSPYHCMGQRKCSVCAS